MTDAVDSRRLRKRETDRIAQKERRKRQKQQLEELQSQLEAREKDIDFLLDPGRLAPIPQQCPMDHSVDKPETGGPQVVTENATCMSPATWADTGSNQECNQPGLADLLDESFEWNTPLNAPPKTPYDFTPSLFDGTESVGAMEFSTNVSELQIPTTSSEQRLADLTAQEFSPYRRNESPQEPCIAQPMVKSHYSRLFNFRCLPYNSILPSNSVESDFLSLLNRSNSIILKTNTPLKASSAFEYFARSRQSPISELLKLYLKPMEEWAGHSEHFGCYWLLYMYIRWLVNKDLESFQDLPSWYHPTQSQLDEKHSPLIDAIPWPSLRDELIQRNQKDDEILGIALDIAKNLELDLAASSDSGEEHLEASICNLKSWRLRENFSVLHPHLYASAQVDAEKFPN